MLIVSYGLGVDSTAMLIGLHQKGLRPDVIQFADVGSEKGQTYAYLPVMQDWCRSVGFPRIEVPRYKPKNPKNGAYTTIEGNCLVNRTLPSLAFGGRSCSCKWKHEPMHRAVSDRLPTGTRAERCIGFDAGPVDARRNGIEADEHYRFSYPLRGWGWTRDDCKAVIDDAGLPVPSKSSCFFCPASKPREIRALEPDLLRRIVRMEANAAPRLDKIDGLWRRPVKGYRGAQAKPGSMSEFIAGEELLPELVGCGVQAWWKGRGPREPGPKVSPERVLGMMERSSKPKQPNLFGQLDLFAA